MGVQPEILTELAINAAKRFLGSDKEGGLSSLVATEVARANRLHKTELTETHVRTVCQMTNRAVHKAMFKKDRNVSFDLATPEKVTAAMKPAKTKTVGTPETVVLQKSGRSTVLSKGKPLEKKASIDIRTKLPGYRNRVKSNTAEVVVDQIQKVASAVDEALHTLPPEEIFGLALIVDDARGNNRLQRLLQDTLEKKAGLRVRKVEQYTGMTPDADHPLVQTMTRFQDAVDMFEKAAKRADNAWVA